MNRGFTLTETLLALFALSFCTLLLIPVLRITSGLTQNFKENTELLGILQLRYILAQSSQLEVTPSSLSFHYHKEDWNFIYHHENIVKEPGYEIFMMHLNKAEFFFEDSCVYLRYQKEQQSYETILSCQ